MELIQRNLLFYSAVTSGLRHTFISVQNAILSLALRSIEMSCIWGGIVSQLEWSHSENGRWKSCKENIKIRTKKDAKFWKTSQETDKLITKSGPGTGQRSNQYRRRRNHRNVEYNCHSHLLSYSPTHCQLL